MDRNSFKQLIFNCSDKDFIDLALHIFYYQAKYNAVYAKFLQLIDIRAEEILNVNEIPYLPIDFFKNHLVSCLDVKPDSFNFTSSSTSGNGISKHYVPNIALYDEAYTKSFNFNFGEYTEDGRVKAWFTNAEGEQEKRGHYQYA